MYLYTYNTFYFIQMENMIMYKWIFIRYLFCYEDINYKIVAPKNYNFIFSFQVILFIIKIFMTVSYYLACKRILIYMYIFLFCAYIILGYTYIRKCFDFEIHIFYFDYIISVNCKRIIYNLHVVISLYRFLLWKKSRLSFYD